MRKNKRINAYKIEHPWLVVLLIIVLFAAYLICCYLEKQDDTEQIVIITEALLNHEETIDIVSHPWIDAAKNLAIVFISILLSSMITIAVIGKNDRNDIYSEAFEDAIDQSNVQIKLPENNKNDVTFTLEKAFKEKSMPKGLLDTVILKVASPELPYYYENCTIDISCRVEDDCIVKTIKKDLYIKSYDAKYTFNTYNVDNKFVIARQSGLEGIVEPLRINKFYVYRNQKAADETSYHSVKEEKYVSPLYEKIGYTKKFAAYYDKELTINRNDYTHIAVEYETRSPSEDLTYVFRVPCACKHLSFKYRFDSDEYRLTGHAFGFFDDANETINSESENALNFVFENWIFKRDGICINMTKDGQRVP